MARVYIDFERYFDKIIEMSAVMVFDQKIISSYHSFIKQPYTLENYMKIALNSHCILPEELDFYGASEDNVKENFYLWISNFTFEEITIAAHGDDCSQISLIKWLPKLVNLKHLSFAQVELPKWIERQYADYHLATKTMKEISHFQICSKQMHRGQFKYLKNTLSHNHSKIARYMFGFHCSYFDCLQLAFYEKTLPLYCCDYDFKDVFIKDISPFVFKK